MSFERTLAPAVEPVTTVVARAHAKVSASLDSLTDIYIRSARELAEHITQRSLITQTWKLRLDRWPEEDDVELWWGPIRSIVSVAYVDAAGDTQTLDSLLYTLDSHVEPGYLIPAYGTTWPDALRTSNAITITFTAGYGDAGTDVPAAIRHWMLMKITTAHEQPASLDASGKAGVLPDRFVDGLLDPFIVHHRR